MGSLRAAAFAATLLALPWPSPAWAGGEDGWAAYYAQQYEQAVQIWTPEAEAGDASAQFGLGIVNDLGQGVPQNAIAACDWYRRAGSTGHIAAAFNTGIMYDSARCGPRRPDLAALWYGRAAGAGHGRAQFNLAQLYAAGDGVPHNPSASGAWYRLAAASGIAAAVGRGQEPVRTASDRPLQPAIPAPTADAAPVAGGPVVLVWAAPEQAAPVRFFVEVAALHGDTTQEVFAGFVDATAVQVTLPPGEQHFAWRVLTIRAEPARYIATGWERIEARR